MALVLVGHTPAKLGLAAVGAGEAAVMIMTVSINDPVPANLASRPSLLIS